MNRNQIREYYQDTFNDQCDVVEAIADKLLRKCDIDILEWMDVDLSRDNSLIFEESADYLKDIVFYLNKLTDQMELLASAKKDLEEVEEL